MSFLHLSNNNNNHKTHNTISNNNSIGTNNQNSFGIDKSENGIMVYKSVKPSSGVKPINDMLISSFRYKKTKNNIGVKHLNLDPSLDTLFPSQSNQFQEKIKLDEQSIGSIGSDTSCTPTISQFSIQSDSSNGESSTKNIKKTRRRSNSTSSVIFSKSKSFNSVITQLSTMSKVNKKPLSRSASELHINTPTVDETLCVSVPQQIVPMFANLQTTYNEPIQIVRHKQGYQTAQEIQPFIVQNIQYLQQTEQPFDPQLQHYSSSISGPLESQFDTFSFGEMLQMDQQLIGSPIYDSNFSNTL